MRGVVFLGERKLELREFTDPTPGPGEVVIAIKASGMCGSDLHPYRAAGNAAKALGLGGSGGPVIGGHEPCGVVAAVGPGVSESQLCRKGIVVYGMTGHGAHAPFMKVPARTLVELPDELSFEEGAAISCGTGTAYGALKRLDVSGRDTLAVFGQGPVGLSATQLGTAMGARVVAVDIGVERRRLAKEFGAETVIDPREVDPVTALRELTRGEGVEAALDCTGNPEARVAAVRSAGTWGRVCFVGEGNTTTFDISQDLIRKQLTILASWTFSAVGQEECARFIADRRIPLQKLLTHRFKLEEAAAAYRLFDTQTTGKGVFLF